MLYRLVCTCILIVLSCVVVCAQIPQTTPLTVNSTRLDLSIVNRGEAAASVQYRLTGRNLDASVTVLAPLGVEVRPTLHGQWRKSMIIERSAQGNVDTTIYVRLDNSAPLLVQSGLRHFVGETEANVRLDVIGIVREKPVIRTTADALEYAGHGLPAYLYEIKRFGSTLNALQGSYGNDYSYTYISKNDGETWLPVRLPEYADRLSSIFEAQYSASVATKRALYTFGRSTTASVLALYRFDFELETWREVAANQPSISVMWTEGATWLAGSNNGLLFRSQDNGISWQRVNDTTLENKSILKFLRPINGQILALTSSFSGQYELLRTMDTGRTWRVIPTSSEVVLRLEYNYNNAVSNGKTCLICKDSVLYRLREDVSGWEKLPRASYLNEIYGFDGHFLAIERSTGKIYRSIDGQQWWKTGNLSNSEEYPYSFANRIISFGATLQIISAQGNILRSLDSGQTWHLLVSGIRSPIAPAYFVQKRKTSWIPYDLPYRLSANSPFWEKNNQEYPYGEVRPDEIRIGKITLRGITGGIIRSTDDGVTGQIITQGFVPNVGVSALHYTNGIVFASGINGIYRSSDSGVSWQSVSKGLEPNANIRGITSIGVTLFAYDINDGLYRSTSYGETWEHIGLPVTTVSYGNKFLPVYSLISSATRLFMNSDGNIYQSGDNGTTWQPLPVDAGIVAYSSPYLYVSTQEGLHRLALPSEPELSISPPALHFRVAANNPSKPTQSIRVVNSGGVAGELRAIIFSQPEDFEVLSSPPNRIDAGDSVALIIRFRSKRPGVTSSTVTFLIGNPFNSSTSALICRISSEVSADAPLDISQTGISSPIAMGDVLPLPTQNEATLYYTLSEDTALTLDMFDMRGQAVRRLAEGIQPKGTHRIDINTAALSNGAYRIILRSGFGAVQRWLVIAK